MAGVVLGKTALVKREHLPANTNQALALIRPITEKIFPSYLHYYLQQPAVFHYVNNSTSQSAQPNINLTEIGGLTIKVPPIAKQKTIAHILGSLDEKIELNRRMNATLEAMAQALFKSWFVDFDPVIDNALAAGHPIPEPLQEQAEARAALGDQRQPLPETIRQQFPNRFVCNEDMGWVPEGWEVLPISDVTEFREGPGILAKDFHQQGVPLIRLAGLKNGVSLLDGCNYLAPDKVEKKWAHFKLEKGDILLSSSASLGRVAEVEGEAIGAIPYTGIIGFRPKRNRTVQRYVKYYLTSSSFQDQVTMMGAGSVLNHFGPTHLKMMYMLVPNLSLQEHFSMLTTPCDLLSIQRLKESQSLCDLRDTLLPKLLSGQLRIPEAEQQGANML